jgi:acetyl-CoA C-acetyltransferase
MPGALDPRTPVIVGVGQVTHHPQPGGEDYAEPVALIVEALRAAGADSGTGTALLHKAESVRVVAVAGWPYRDAGALIADDLGISPRETVQTNAFGGDGPQRLINETAAAILAGELDVALIGGGESVASQIAAQKAGATPDWRTQGEDVTPTRISGSDRYPVNDAEAAVGIAAPLDMYALIESAVGARAGEDPATHLTTIAELWSRFSLIAAENPYAWLPRAYTAVEIATPSARNRAVSSPYTKLLSANIQVDQTAGLIICSVEAARAAGVAADRWVFIHTGAQAQDEWHVTERSELAASPAIRAIGAAALQHAGTTIDEIAHIDLYSCFPSAVQIAAAELGTGLGRRLTQTGGLTFAGGPGNNYATHGVAMLVARLREDPDALGLATALGWYATKHAIGIYSARPPQRPFRSLSPMPENPPPRRARTDYTGPARLEAFTVQRDRDGEPQAAALAALTPQGDRAMVRLQDPAQLTELLAGDPVGQAVAIDGPTALSFSA